MSNGQDRKYKYWCFTINNYTEEEVERLRTVSGQTSYMVFGREVGDNGTAHLQGYVEFGNRVRLLQLKRLLLERGHYERRRGTSLEASDYCKKDGDYEEFGELSQVIAGQRTDLIEIKDKIKSGVKEVDIADEYFGDWVRYNKSFKRYRDIIDEPKLRVELSVYYLWGAPGTGKTRLARHRSMEGGFWIASDVELKWFDGYGGEPNVILDDYRGAASDSWILRVLDIYELRVPIKGGFVSWNPVNIYLTSNLPVYEMHQAVQEAFRRRIKKIIHFENVLDFDNEREMERMEGYF